MEERPADGWEVELGRWLEPFLVRLRRQAQRHWAPFYLKGLILPGERKSIEPITIIINAVIGNSPRHTADQNSARVCGPE